MGIDNILKDYPAISKYALPAAAATLGGPLGWAGLALTAGQGIMQGIAGSKAEDEEKRRREEDLVESKRRFGIEQDNNIRQMGMQGLSLLADERSKVMAKKRSLSFRNDYLTALGG